MTPMQRISYKELVVRIDTKLDSLKEDMDEVKKHVSLINGATQKNCIDIKENSGSVKWMWRIFLFVGTPLVGAIIYLAVTR